MFRVEQHTADIRVALLAGTPEELFADAVRGLMTVMKPARTGAGGDTVDIDIEAPDRTALLVDFLNEVLLRCHTERRSFEPESIVLRDSSLAARLQAGPPGGFEEDVKAVTYHEADVRLTSSGWATTLVFDV